VRQRVNYFTKDRTVELFLGCKLRYTLEKATGFALQVEVAKAEGQMVSDEALVIPGGASNSTYSVFTNPLTRNRVVRTVIGPGAVEIHYEARVDLDSKPVDSSRVHEFDFADLPMENLEYLAPSRYCASDTFTNFAFQMFGGMQRGHSRVTAICDWIHNHIRYQSGSTGPNTSSDQVFQKGVGVCRDFAHLGISFCRALGIPARYVSAYAHALSPQDFHAVFQAFLNGPDGGAWYSFDPSHMSSVDSIARIAAGRDAADVAFAWPQGEVVYESPVVWVNAPSRGASVRTANAIGHP
jgi:transglutaminase-like putative cysteine protease